MYVAGREGARTQLEVIFIILRRKGATGFDGDTDTTVACRALGDSLTPGKCNCQSRTGTRSLISCDVLPSEARGGGRARCSGLVQGRCSAAEDENILG